MYEMYHENRKLLTDAECYELRDNIIDTTKYSHAHYTSVREIHMSIPSSDNEYIIRTSSEEKGRTYLIKRSIWGEVINEYREIISKSDCMHLLSYDTDWMKENNSSIIQEIYLQIECNQCEFSQIVEHLQEVYINPYIGERITINILDKFSTNMITEFFENSLSYYPCSHKRSFVVTSQKSLASPVMVIPQRGGSV